MTIKNEILVQYGITPNEYYYLFLLANEIKPLVDISSYSINYGKLEKLGFVKVSDSIIARKLCYDVFKEEQYVYDDTQTKMAIAIKSVDNWIDNWRELFPSNKEVPSEYPLRGSRVDCLKNMKAFIKLNFKKKKLTKQLIFDATIVYLNERRKDGFKYTKLANYFIKKDGVSFLEMYVDKVIELKDSGIAIDDTVHSTGESLMAKDI